MNQYMSDLETLDELDVDDRTGGWADLMPLGGEDAWSCATLAEVADSQSKVQLPALSNKAGSCCLLPGCQMSKMSHPSILTSKLCWFLQASLPTH